MDADATGAKRALTTPREEGALAPTPGYIARARLAAPRQPGASAPARRLLGPGVSWGSTLVRLIRSGD
jgi:hypothetical protein